MRLACSLTTMAGRLKVALAKLDKIATPEHDSTSRLRSHSFNEFSSPSPSQSSGKTLKRAWNRKLPIEPANEMASIDAILEERVHMQARATPPDSDLRQSIRISLVDQPETLDYDDMRGALPVDLDALHNARHHPWSPTRTPAYSRQNSEEDSQMTPRRREPFMSLTNGASPADQDFNAPLNFEGPVGISGLSNLGNTCFMNAALQCLSATIPLSTHLRTGAYKKQLNRHSKMGSGGYMTRALARLFRVMVRAILVPDKF
jgi:hypothetical protein